MFSRKKKKRRPSRGIPRGGRAAVAGMFALLAVMASRAGGDEPKASSPQPWAEAIIARVNGTPILLSELREAALDQSIPLSALTAEGLRGDGFRRAITILVHELLLVQEAGLQEIKANEIEVTRRVEEMIQQLIKDQGGEGGFSQFLTRYQLTLDGLRRVLTERETRQELAARVVAKRVNVSSEEVEAFKTARQNEGRPSEETSLAQILIRCPRAEQQSKTGRELFQKAVGIASEAGRDRGAFAKEARTMNDDPAARERAGALGWIDPASLRPEIRDQVAKMEPGDISEPIATDEGYHILHLRGRHTARDMLFTEKFEIERRQLIEALQSRATINIYPLGDEAAKP